MVMCVLFLGCDALQLRKPVCCLDICGDSCSEWYMGCVQLRDEAGRSRATFKDAFCRSLINLYSNMLRRRVNYGHSSSPTSPFLKRTRPSKF